MCFLLPIAVAAAISLSSADVSAATLVGYWAFDDGQGAIATDSSTYANDGTIHNAIWVQGKRGKALAFDGNTAYVQVSNSAQYNMTEALSVEVWVLMMPWQSCTQPDIFDKSHRGPDEPPYFSGYALQGVQGGSYAVSLVACNGSSCPDPCHSGIALNDSIWHFLVGTVSTEDGLIRFYLDGDLTMEQPYSGPLATNSGDIFVGRHYLLGRYFSGLIDEVKIFDGALTPEEVMAHYRDLAPWICGDVNNDGIVNLGDVVYTIGYLYRGGPPPEPYACIGDVNADEIVNLGDVVYLIGYLYRGGPVPLPDCCEPPWASR